MDPQGPAWPAELPSLGPARLKEALAGNFANAHLCGSLPQPPAHLCCSAEGGAVSWSCTRQDVLQGEMVVFFSELGPSFRSGAWAQPAGSCSHVEAGVPSRKPTGNISRSCSHSGEEFHSCVPGWDATVHFLTAFATAAHTFLDKSATSPLPCVGDRRCQSGSMGERESNTANQFWSPLLHLPSSPFEHSSWVRLNRLLSGLTSFTAVHRLGLLSSPHCDGRAASRSSTSRWKSAQSNICRAFSDASLPLVQRLSPGYRIRCLHRRESSPVSHALLLADSQQKSLTNTTLISPPN
ncbi:unnamed protein product [Eretmochelys imbricata]